MKTVIFVDDEASILEGLRRNLRRMRAVWDMHFFTQPEDALAFVRANTVDAIVSDMRMPGMTGAELLQAVQNEKPQTLRLALSGYADSELILESVHAIHRYIAKPAELETICEAVTSGIALQEQLADPSLRAFVGSLGALPSLPRVYDQLMALIGTEDFGLEEVSALIEEDVGLSATVLKIVNSAFFGNFGNIESLRQSVSMLGADTLKNIVLTEQLIKKFDKADVAELERINAFCKFVSGLAHRLAQAAKLGKRATDHSQLAGMICGLGDMIILDRGELENPEHAFDPPLIAAHVLSLWAMSHTVVEAVAHHRIPVDVGAEANPNGVTAADCVRASWIACNTYLHAPDGVQAEQEEALREVFAYLAQDRDLANTWYENVRAMV